MAPKFLVFDMDDTLYLERDYARSGFAAVGEWLASERGVAGFGDTAWQLFVAGERGDIFDRGLHAHGIECTAALVKTLVGIYREHAPAIAMAADARAYLARAPQEQPMALITDGPAASQRAKIDALGLRAHLEPCVVTSELPGDGAKPSPDAFVLVQRALGAEGSACCYVGDNPKKDFVAPHALGWTTVRIRRSGGLHHDLPSGDDVQIEIRSFDELATVLAIEQGVG